MASVTRRVRPRTSTRMPCSASDLSWLQKRKLAILALDIQSTKPSSLTRLRLLIASWARGINSPGQQYSLATSDTVSYSTHDPCPHRIPAALYIKECSSTSQTPIKTGTVWLVPHHPTSIVARPEGKGCRRYFCAQSVRRLASLLTLEGSSSRHLFTLGTVDCIARRHFAGTSILIRNLKCSVPIVHGSW